jgi:hypothetical protein
MALTKIQSLGITDGTIVNADINASAAIAGTKLSGAGKVLQVLQSTTSTQQSITSGTHADLTSLNVAITPATTASKFLIMYSVQFFANHDDGINIRILRNSTTIVNTGSTTEFYYAGSAGGGNIRARTSYQFLDAPSTTSAITYKLTAGRHSGTVQVNEGGHFQSSITVMEIAS